MTELKPCPFCQCEMDYAANKAYCWHPHNTPCALSNKSAIFFEVAKWNTRAPTPATPGEDRVREDVQALLDLVEATEAVDAVSDDTKDVTCEQHKAAFEKLDKAMKRAKALLKWAKKEGKT